MHAVLYIYSYIYPLDFATQFRVSCLVVLPTANAYLIKTKITLTQFSMFISWCVMSVTGTHKNFSKHAQGLNRKYWNLHESTFMLNIIIVCSQVALQALKHTQADSAACIYNVRYPLRVLLKNRGKCTIIFSSAFVTWQ